MSTASKSTTVPATPASDFAVTWLGTHLHKKPDGVDGLTWVVGLGYLYTEYTTAAYRTPHGVLPYDGFMNLVRFLYPAAKEGKVQKKLVLGNVRYYKNPEELHFGI